MRSAIRRRRGVMVVLGLVLLTAPPVARAQLTVTAPARQSTLGAFISGSPAGCPQKIVTFDVAGVDVVRSVQVSMTVVYNGRIGQLGAFLTDPGGRALYLFPRGGVLQLMQASLQGTYEFTDAAPFDWDTAAAAAGPTAISPGSYRAIDSTGAAVPLDEWFGDRRATGAWTLTFINCAGIGGVVFGASLTIGGNAALEVDATSSTLGAIPDSPAGPQLPAVPRDVTFVVPPGRGPVMSVRLSMEIRHPHAGDVVARLIAPTGQSHVLFGYTGATSATHLGSSTDLHGTYEFRDGYLGSPWWANVLFGGNPVPSGTYNTSELGGPGATGIDTLMDPVFAGVPSAGVWTLRLTDGTIRDLGDVLGARLSLETRATPTAVGDTYSTAYLSTLGVAAPGVLGNDLTGLGTGMTAELVSQPAHGTVSFQANGAFSYTPAIGFVGTDSFLYRARTAQGAGTTATASITVVAPTTAQAPYGLVASVVAGNEVTLRWQVPPGPVPVNYVMEGGIAPGQTLGAVAVGGPQPILTFAAPSGVFFLRVHAITNGQRTASSNEIRVVVNVPQAPSAPAGLTGVVDGDRVGLTWMNTFAGGAVESLQLVVTGAAAVVVPLPLSDSFAFTGVPPGTYTLRVRALNGTGTSVESNPVTLTFPSGCSGAPATPPNFLAYAVGNIVHVLWDPPATGPAALGYVMQVTGSYTASLPLSARSFRAPAPPGTYGLSVVAVNSCGASAPTAPQDVFVP